MPRQPNGAASHEPRESDAGDDRPRSEVLRALLWTFIFLTGSIALIGLSVGAYREATISVIGGSVYAVLLLGLRRWGTRRVGYLCTLWYFLLATATIASGRGIYDVTMVLFPAGIFMGALLLRRRHLWPLIALTVATVTAVSGAKITGILPTPAVADNRSWADVLVVTLLLLVSGTLAHLVVRSVQSMLFQRRRAEETALRAKLELEERNESLELVNELAHRLQRTHDIEAIARETVEVLIRHSQPPSVAFYLLEDGGTSLQLIADHGFTAEERTLGRILPVAQSLSGIAVREQRLVSSSDLTHEGRGYQPVLEALARRGIASALSIPLAFEGHAFGTVNILSPQPREFSELDLDTFRGIGQAVSLAIANSRLLAGLEYRAFHDTLTSLPNRASLHRNFPVICSQGDSVGLVLLDVNRFRVINESLGHHVGDELLVQIGSRLAASLAGQPSEAYRLGGDEFAVLLPGLSSTRDAEEAAQQLLTSLHQPFNVAGMALEVGGSAGVSHYPNHGNDSHELLRCADVALYRAKKTAGGVAVFSREFDEHTPERLAMMSELAAAIREGGLRLHFQPKVALEDESVIGFEALIRWQHPVRGFLSPAAFLPFAEASDVINPMTYWVVENALTQLGRWNETYPGLTMAINLSMRNLLDRNCSDRLEEIIRKAGVDPSLVEFELTETAILTDQDTASSMLGRITSTGARLAIDDFGTGYSSLAYLRRFPVHTIKIDRSFVGDMLLRDQSRAIVGSTVQLARSLGLSVVAEGIENRPTADALREMGCDLAQGFFFAPPAPAEEIGRRMEAHTLLSGWA